METQLINKTQRKMMFEILAVLRGYIGSGLGWLVAGVVVGLVGMKMAVAVGLYPGAVGQILVQGIIGMALAEAVAFYAIFLAK